MKIKISLLGLFAYAWAFVIISACSTAPTNDRAAYVKKHYDKQEVYIEMRDGVKLFTSIYTPKDKSKSYPILMQRTPYNVAPYGTDAYKTLLGPSPKLMQDGYIFVYQDVRGRWMSEGEYDNMRPTIPAELRLSNTDIDESTDTFDTIEWLINNLEGNNGRVGQWGISYPGFYSAAALPYAHPALKAVSPQAPIGDFYFDDFHHNGAYFLSYWLATSVFGYQKDKPTTEAWYQMVNPGTEDGYQFYLDMGPLKNASKWYGEDNFFWQQLVEHPDYDDFWKPRNIVQHMKDITPAVMVVGGWFDAEDLYGPLEIYKQIEKNNPAAYNTLVMGPWSHGDWARESGTQRVGNIAFGDSISTWYQNNVEYEFFNHFLKGPADGKTGLPDAYMFDTGKKTWTRFDQWPPANAQTVAMYAHEGGKLSTSAPTGSGSFSEFISDPAKPVPYSEDIHITFTPRKYMSDDQRFAARRPDVLVYETEVLTEDLTLAGEIFANLNVSITGTDSDWIVKLIDVYPHDTPTPEWVTANQKLSNYHQMVRSESMRGRYREGFDNPKPFVPNKVTAVNFQLQDVYHTFKKGHKIQIQVQSTWFPLIDRNPQKYVENVFKANEEDFIKATHRLWHDIQNPSHITVQVLR
jgi:putative CocE/NonD family hydrolase